MYSFVLFLDFFKFFTYSGLSFPMHVAVYFVHCDLNQDYLFLKEIQIPSYFIQYLFIRHEL